MTRREDNTTWRGGIYEISKTSYLGRGVGIEEKNPLLHINSDCNSFLLHHVALILGQNGVDAQSLDEGLIISKGRNSWIEGLKGSAHCSIHEEFGAPSEAEGSPEVWFITLVGESNGAAQIALTFNFSITGVLFISHARIKIWCMHNGTAGWILIYC